MDLGENEFLEYILEDDTVNVIAIYLESFKEPRKFISLCRKAKQLPKKSIILVKGGKTSQGMKAASSHTGALAENERLIDAIIKQAGVVQAESKEIGRAGQGGCPIHGHRNGHVLHQQSPGGQRGRSLRLQRHGHRDRYQDRQRGYQRGGLQCGQRHEPDHYATATSHQRLDGSA